MSQLLYRYSLNQKLFVLAQVVLYPVAGIGQPKLALISALMCFCQFKVESHYSVWADVYQRMVLRWALLMKVRKVSTCVKMNVGERPEPFV